MQDSDFRGIVGGLSLRQAAGIAGVTYLLNPVTFAQGYAMPRLFVDDPAQTVANLSAHPHLFVAAILCYFFSLLGDAVFAWCFYVLLAPVNRALSLLGAFLQLTYVAVSISAVANLGLLYRLVSVPSYSSQVSAAEVKLQAPLLLGGFHSGWGLGLMLFGLHLVVRGWLFARSTYLPRWIGWVLMLVGVAWVVDSLGVYLFPGVPLGFLNILFGGELILMVWLLGWGWRLRSE